MGLHPSTGVMAGRPQLRLVDVDEIVQSEAAPGPPAWLKDFLEDMTPSQVISAARAPESDPDLLRLIARRKLPSEELEQALIANPSSPAEVVDEISRSSLQPSRYTAAMHPNATDEVKERLSRDESFPVRAAIASREDTKEPIVRRLAGDSVAAVRAAAQEHLNRLAAERERLRSS